MFDGLDVVARQQDPRLLTLVGVLCAIMVFAAVTLLARVRGITRATLAVWLGAALVFGCGLWALNFAAVLGIVTPLPVGYDLNTVLMSLAASVAGSVAGFGAFVADRGRLRGAAFGGALLGAGALGAHYLGVASMRPDGGHVTDTTPVAPAAMLVIAFTILTLIRSAEAKLVLRRIEAAAYMMIALVGLYAVGMSGVAVLAGDAAAAGGTRLGPDSLPIALGTAGMTVLLLSLASDLLDRQALSKVRQESERLMQLVGAAFEGTVIHRDGIVLETNEAFRRLGGWTDEAPRGRQLAEFVAGGGGAALGRRLTAPADDAPPLAFDLALSDGTAIPVEVVSRSIEYEGGSAVVSGFKDLSARLRAEERVRHLAHHDALTGLPNRFLLSDRLTQALSLAKRNGTIVSVFQLDLHRFKAVNDLLGHEAGDALLIEVGRRLSATLRASDTLARLGGDEFAIVQPLVQQPREAASLARRVIEVLSEPFEIANQTAEIGVSVGIAVHPQDGETAVELMHNADTAMHRAKHEGDNAFLFFEPLMDQQLHERRRMEQDLRQALARSELEVYYQPLFDCDAATVTGFEALVRWHHPARGMISPADFIPLAEECGLIGAIGKWVLERACLEAASWSSPYRIAVNLSPVQFRQPDLPGMVAETLARTGLAPSRLELEITEGVLMDNTDRVVEVLASLKAQGINISLDDFGTGYSSLSYLRRFPFDKIKIDKAFIKGLGEDDEAAAIVRAIVALGRSLRLSITAEGVETEDQLSALRTLECNQVQGFLLGRPMPNHHLPALMGAVEPVRV